MRCRWRRETRRRVHAQEKARPLRRDAEGRVVVDMTVRDDSDFLSVFSEWEMPVISAGVAEFLENRTRFIPPREPLTLRIHSDCIDEREQGQYRAAIQEYYTEQYIANRREIRRNIAAAVILLLLGVAFLVAALFRTENIVGAEIVDIVAWVLIWEAVDILFFVNRSLRWQEKRYLAYLDMRIVYLPA